MSELKCTYTVYSKYPNPDDEIDSLRAENVKLREALERIAKFSNDPIATGLWKHQSQIDAMKKIAQEALKNE